MLIRPMSVGDAGAVASLNREMQYHSEAEQIAARFETISCQAGNALFVAERDGSVVGWAHVRIVELLQMDAYAALVGLAVHRDARRQQVGASLIGACRAWAAQRGHAEVRVP
jgi:predicted N-acetyltransferase YhbS